MKERFEKNFKKTEAGCWEWQAALSSAGYGLFWLDGNNGLAHRVAHFLYRGTSLEGQNLYHTCGNKKCVNPGLISFNRSQ